jgi:hypothetical protein
MRRICHLALAGLVAFSPVAGWAETKDQDAPAKKKKHKKPSAAEEEEAREAERAQLLAPRHRHRRHKADANAPEEAPPEGAAQSTPEADAPRKTAPPDDASAAAAPAEPPAAAEADDDFEDNPARWLQVINDKVPPRRYGVVLGVGMLAVGLVFGYLAQGEAKRGQTVTSASEAQGAIANARASASLANVLYLLAVFAAATAAALEFLPEPAAEKASLTFHF